MKNHMSHY